MDAATPQQLTALEQVAQSPVFDSLAPPIKIAFVLGALTLLSTAIISLTSFTRIVIVLSFVRRALTTQEIPPNSAIIGLSLFMTLFIMGSTWDAILSDSVQPYLQKSIGMTAALERGVGHMRSFMIRQARRQDLGLFIQMSGISPPATPADTPLRVLIPAFMISEMKTAFIMGFCIYIPFILIDLFVSTTLMSLGMMMMPPVVVSAPLKLLLFVLVDGWNLVARALSASFL